MNQPNRLKAVMLDWAGTTVDHGSVAPVVALQTLFASKGVTLSAEDARRDMGLLKRDHIQAILQLPHVRLDWHNRFGQEPGLAEVAALYEEFGPIQMEIITRHSQLIEGVAQAVLQWQRRGLRIGSSTGYTREMLAPVMRQAEAQGYKPDASVCPDEVGAGRPAPWMLTRNAQLLEVYPPSTIVKVGDTISDIEEGRNAGMWTIGLSRTGNMLGLTASEVDSLPESQRRALIAQAESTLLSHGADFVAEDLPGCDAILTKIENLTLSRR